MMLPSNYSFVEILVESYNSDLEKCKALIETLDSFESKILNVTIEHNYRHHRELKDIDIDLKSQYWREVYTRSNLNDIISSKSRKEIENSFYSNPNLPDFTEENIKTTVEGWYLDSYRMFGEKVDLLFQRLSGEHVTNSPSGFSKKMIYKYMINYACSWGNPNFDLYTFNDDAVGLIHDLRTSIQMLFGLPISERNHTYDILKAINARNEYTEFDNNAFKIKVFKNGNSHIEVHPHVAILLNQELAKIYPSAIPPKHRVVTKEINEYDFKYDHLSNREISQLKEFVLSSSHYTDAYGKVIYRMNKRFMESEFITEILKFFQVETVEKNNSYVSDFELTDVFRHIITNGVIEYKSNQFYPTPENIVNDLVDYVGDTTGKTILEPSAGMGNIASKFENVTCIDKEPMNCVILKERKLNVIYSDFLKYNKSKFDIVVMNPPYNKKQWKTHTLHALDCLKSNGEVWAVLPLGKEEELSENANVEVIQVYTNEFDNTSISTAIYKLTKK